jgi:RNA polymerase sigma factor (sigma-70 family)
MPFERRDRVSENVAGRAIDAVWRIESPRLIAGLTRLTRDVGVAEDLAQDALVAALEQWPASGVPANPGAWLMAIAKRRAIDRFRREELGERKRDEFGHLEVARSEGAPGFEASLDDDIGDDLLRLVFIACHPILSRQARVALTLRLIGGLTTAEIARAYLASEATIAQRIVRAKRTLAEARVPFEMPQGTDRAGRVASVLEVVYLIFNEGYCATVGDDWLRPSLCEDALRMGRIVATLMPSDAEVHGLVALLEIQASRTHARIGPNGEPILLLDQDRSRWNRLLIRRGFEALDRAERLGGPLGPYTLQAAIAACHARASVAEDTDWVRIAALYDALLEVLPSPIVALNRAVAVGFAYGPQAGLEAVEELRFEKSLEGHYLLASVRGDLLARLGRHAEAAFEFRRAAAATENLRERTLLLDRARAAGDVDFGPRRSTQS